MDQELMFRRLLAAVLVSMAVIRVCYLHKSPRWAGAGGARGEAAGVERARRLLRPIWLLTLAIWIGRPEWLAWAALPLLVGLRWSGAVLGVLGCLVFLWAHHALADNFSTTLRIRAGHTLIQHGPYRWVRHPIYTSVLLMFASFCLLSANGLIGAEGILWCLGMCRLRTPREEAMMVATFGDEYRAYMRRTGRYFPRLSRSSGVAS